MKDRIKTGKLPVWLTPFYSSLPHSTHIIRNSSHRERFERQQRHILREFQIQLQDLIVDIYETRSNETKELFQAEVERLNKYNKRFDITTEYHLIQRKLVDQYLGLIEEKMKTVYSYKLNKLEHY